MEFTFFQQKDITGFDEYGNVQVIDTSDLIFYRCDSYGYILAESTDFAKALGADIDSYNNTSWWLKDFAVRGRCNYTISSTGIVEERFIIEDNIGCRPVIKNLKLEEIPIKTTGFNYKFITFEYGEYPQRRVYEVMEKKLEEEYENGKLIETGKSYTHRYEELLSEKDDTLPFDVPFPDNGTEYIYNDKKYVRLNTKPFPTWYQVKPIVWRYHKKSKTAFTSEILFPGAIHDHNNNPSSFEETDMYKYLNTTFKKEIIPDELKQEIKEEKKVNRTQNPYNFDFSEVTEEEIIKGAIQSNVSVFLHGRSSEGKSARVKQLDPDCEIIYMRNATPDSLNGKSVYNQNTGEMIDIPPTWYTKIKEKCEKEPNKIHLVFFDELTNALPSIQGMAFNIILDGEINGKWKLPKNARIVAAGNDLTDSLAANQMAEPLFNRFAHVYINTEVEDWLNWAVTPEEEYQRIDYIEKEKTPKIHPAIYSYISYKSFSGKDILRTPYNGETPNADPRKWEMASKVLTETNRPEMLRSLIGEKLTSEFVYFLEFCAVTVEDVLNKNYRGDEGYQFSLEEKFLTTSVLAGVDDTHFEEVRDFVKKLDVEPSKNSLLNTFELFWAHGDKKRLEKIAELHVKDMENGEYIPTKEQTNEEYTSKQETNFFEEIRRRQEKEKLKKMQDYGTW